MSRRFGLAVMAITGALALSGCATSVPSVDVTRFHAPGAVPQSGGIVVEPQPGPPDDSIEYRTFAGAVAQELQRVGFTDESGRQTLRASDYVALIAYDREVRSPNDMAGGRSPVSVGVGGGTGSYGSGLGVGVGINLSGKPKDIVITRLSVQIRRRADNQPVWEGRAETSAKVGTPASQAGLAAGKLADAMFRDYPGTSGQTITVK
ncbi:MAG: DUF4136 domain-containing protein [Sphingobium sp.]